MAIRNPAAATPHEAQSNAAKKYCFVEQSMTHPKFLHSNSTSHIWAFGAIAELVDNATDPDVMATRFWIDVEEEKNGQPRLCFTDNGYGMEIDKLYKMLSFGYCEKEEVNGHKPIGHYGNGFKSGSMRLGRDVIVFSKSKSTYSIGMLSQTFLFAENATSVLIPMVTWDATGKCLTELQAAEQSLGAIQTYSPFKTIHDMMNRFKRIPNGTKRGTGTHIVVYNLRTVGKERDAPYELDFETDPCDIRIANVLSPKGKKLHFQQHQNGQGTQVKSPIDFSLREYCSILYSKPRIIIVLRRTKVQPKFVDASLANRMFDVYKNTRITFGMNVDNPNLYGIMLYHRNRLIKPYLRVGIQNQINPDAVGVIGIIEADFLQPTHNKQDFDINTRVYKNCIQTLATKLEAYWESYKNKSRWQQKLRTDLADWSSEDVQFLLSEIGLKAYTSAFASHKIDGALLSALDTCDLTSANLKLTFKEAKRVLMYVYLVQAHHDIYTIPPGVLQWNNDTVCTWLKDNKFGHLVDVFRKHQITGAELAFLEKVDLNNHLKIQALGDIIKLQKEISILKNSLSNDRSLQNQRQKTNNVNNDYVARQLEEMKRFNEELKLTLKQRETKIPEAFICPIMQDMMQEPVVASDGHTYERTAIELWLKSGNSSPVTGLQLPNKQLTPSHTLKSMIREFIDAKKKK